MANIFPSAGMKCLLIYLFILVASFGSYTFARVSSVSAYQSGNNIVITYHLSKQSDISVEVSTNGGRTYNKIYKVEGDVGRAVSSGNKSITWRVLDEYDEFNFSNVAFRVNYSGDYKWTNIILANAALSSLHNYDFGLTCARVNRGGFYLSAMTNFGFKFDQDSKIPAENYQDYFYTGEKKTTILKATAGAVVRMGIPMYAYLGAGYGYRGLYYESVDGQWIAMQNKQTIYHGATVEVGVIGDIKGFALSLGFSMICAEGAYYPEAKIGVGFSF